jgi:putative endonuclease
MDEIRPWQIIYEEQHASKLQALEREKELKSFKGREFIRNA